MTETRGIRWMLYLVEKKTLFEDQQILAKNKIRKPGFKIVRMVKRTPFVIGILFE